MGIFNFVKPVKKNIDTTPVENTENKTNTESVPEEKTIVLDGPLSTIYTQALKVVYDKNVENEEVSTESQVNDVIISNSIKVLRDNKDDPDYGYLNAEDKKHIDDSYIYVTDTETLDKLGSADAFNSLHIALGMEMFKNIGICIETNTNTIPNNLSNLTIFCKENNIRMFFNRQSAVNYITR